LHTDAGPSDQALIAEAKRWLNGAIDGLGQGGDVGGEKVRYYRGDGFTHEFKGYGAARHRLGADYGELLAEVQAGERSVKREIVGIVGEMTRGGTQCMVCEALDLSSGNSVVISQPFKKSFLRKKRIGSAQVLGPAASLQYTPTNPELKRLISELDDVAKARLVDRQAELSAARLELLHFFSKRGGDRVLWDYSVVPQRAGKQLSAQLKSKPVWQDAEAVISIDEFRDWLDQRIDLALKAP
jgi:hypothetical protein